MTIKVRLLHRLFAALVCLMYAIPFSLCAQGNMRIGVNIRNTGWGGAANCLSNGNWNATYLTEMGIYASVRFMEQQTTNETQGVVNWANRNMTAPFTYELSVDLCNRIDADGWWNVPARATDDYVRGLAQLLFSSLEPGRVAYIEYGNELWNTAPWFIANTSYAADKCTELQLVSPEPARWEYKTAYYQMYRILQIQEIFRQVYGDALQQRARFIAGSFVSDVWWTNHLIAAAKLDKVNPGKNTIDGFGVAPYFGGAGDAAALPLKSHKGTIDANYNAHFKCSAKLVAYEGGQDNDPGFQQNAASYEVYKTHFDFAARYMDLYCHYTEYGSGWGAKTVIGQPDQQAPKYRAIRDWTQAHPYDPSLDASAAQAPGPRLHPVSSAGASGLLFDLTGRRYAPVYGQDLRPGDGRAARGVVLSVDGARTGLAAP